MMKYLSDIREHPDEYPITNVRWEYGLAFFILPPAAAGYMEGGPRLAVSGFALGLGITLFASLLFYSGDKYDDSLPARITLAALLTAVVCLLAGFAGLLLFVVMTTASGGVVLALLGAVVLGVFCTIFNLLS